MQKYISEFIGTFVLLVSIVGSGIAGQQYTNDQMVILFSHAVVIGFTLIFIIRIFANFSGAHFNPAVTIAFAYAKKFAWKEVPKYIIVQILGAFVASGVLLFLFPESEFLGSTIPKVDVWRAFVLELLLTFFLMVTIINVSTGSKEIGVIAGIAIGGVVLLEAIFAGSITNASMNPARSLGPNIVSGNIEGLWLYLVAPVLGALLAVVSCKLVKDDNCCDESLNNNCQK